MTPPESPNATPYFRRKTRTWNAVEYAGNGAARELMFAAVDLDKGPDVAAHVVFVVDLDLEKKRSRG